MINSDLYYKKCLQGLCYYLTCVDNMELAQALSVETDIEKLKNYIIEKKKEIAEWTFYYAAGQISMFVIKDEIKGDENKLSNIVLDGIAKFEEFLDDVDSVESEV